MLSLFNIFGYQCARLWTESPIGQIPPCFQRDKQNITNFMVARQCLQIVDRCLMLVREITDCLEIRQKCFDTIDWYIFTKQPPTFGRPVSVRATSGSM